MNDLPGDYTLKISLKLIAAIEKDHGSLYRMAENLLEQSLPFSTMAAILKIIYRYAGCKMPEDELDDFILRQPCAELLGTILLEILEPVERLGAILPGEEHPAPKK